MREYKPSNKISGLGLLIGAVVYFVSNLIYLIIFFPIIMGGLGGAVIAVFFGVLIALLLL
jgi:hypothetical protein